MTSHLQLADPGAVPVRQTRPLHEELPLGAALERGCGQGVVGCPVGVGGQLSRQRRLPPRPVQNLLYFTFQGGTLQERPEVE